MSNIDGDLETEADDDASAREAGYEARSSQTA
jgi:hypothetical protein